MEGKSQSSKVTCTRIPVLEHSLNDEMIEKTDKWFPGGKNGGAWSASMKGQRKGDLRVGGVVLCLDCGDGYPELHVR